MSKYAKINVKYLMYFLYVILVSYVLLFILYIYIHFLKILYQYFFIQNSKRNHIMS